jgi:iron complex transport system substrate-binding protein
LVRALARPGPWSLSALVLLAALLPASRPEARTSLPSTASIDESGSRSASNLISGCVADFDAATDYFPDKAAIEDAANFSVEYRRSYKVVTVREAYAGAPPERYVLVQCGTPAPALDGALTGAQVVTVPVASVFSSSSTHLSALVDLDRREVLTGVSRVRDITDGAIAARAATGQVREFAPKSVVDAELVVSSRPSLFITGGAVSASFAVIRQAGIPVVAVTEWLEPTPLARAEWMKYTALFLNEERKAERLYGAVKARYAALRARATALPADERPLVMTGRGARGLFTIAGGRSYVAALIGDAGGRYVWADNQATGSVSIDLEAQIRRAADADVWINGGAWANLAAIVGDEPRYAAFKAWRDGQVWVYERRLTPDGRNDYWSRGVTHPDVVLADLVKILHPDLMARHAFEWYMPVPGREAQ